jgi:glutathione S-transferase
LVELDFALGWHRRRGELRSKEILVPLRRSDSKELIRAYSPSERIPALRIEHGDSETVVFDSLAICETLAERHSDAGLWPEDAATRALARSYAAEMHSGFLALCEALSMDFARNLATRLRRRGVSCWRDLGL